MADERDSRLSQHYRGLEQMEPPAALDQAILAAARRATDRPHAPLVAPAGRHRWYYSLAAATVLFFAVALTLHIEQRPPDAEMQPASAPAPEAPLKLEHELRAPVERASEKASAAAEPVKPRPKPVMRQPQFAPDPVPQSAEPALAAQAERRADTATAEVAAVARSAPASVAAQRAPAPAAAFAPAMKPSPARDQLASAAETPERWLERIAELRSRGRHAEADKELAEFRRVHPNYRISEVMRERVEGR